MSKGQLLMDIITATVLDKCPKVAAWNEESLITDDLLNRASKALQEGQEGSLAGAAEEEALERLRPLARQTIDAVDTARANKSFKQIFEVLDSILSHTETGLKSDVVLKMCRRLPDGAVRSVLLEFLSFALYDMKKLDSTVSDRQEN